jgi:hypothetical protein
MIRSRREALLEGGQSAKHRQTPPNTVKVPERQWGYISGILIGPRGVWVHVAVCADRIVAATADNARSANTGQCLVGSDPPPTICCNFSRFWIAAVALLSAAATYRDAALCGIGDARRGCEARVKGVLRGV